MDKIIDRLYQMELNAEQSLDTINEKKLTLKERYDALRTEYQKEAERKFDEQAKEIEASYEKEKNEQLQTIEDEFERNLEQIHKIFDHEQDRYVEMFMNTVKELGAVDDE
jgi:F0F1-type ATP synthase membrane subunit b/b'